MSPVILSIERVGKSYRNRDGTMRVAVRDVTIEVRRGECVALLGPNGSGKSTTIACAIGLYPPGTGRVTIAGHDVQQDHRAAWRHLGVCLQDQTLDTEMNVVEQLLWHAAYYGISPAVARDRAYMLLDNFRLADRARSSIAELSGGMLRMLQIARALMSDPAILVLDEPSVGLDPEIRRILWNNLKQRIGDGLAVLLTTHYMEEAEFLSDRIVLIAKGEIRDQGLVCDLIARCRNGHAAPQATSLEDVYLHVTADGSVQ